MDVESLAGVILGSVSLLGGYVCRKVLVSDRFQVPRFNDFNKLHDYLDTSSSGRQADVLVEGHVGKPFAGKTRTLLRSKETQLEGAVAVITTAPYAMGIDGKLLQASAVETMNTSVDFSLFDFHGCPILVQSVHKAKGLKLLLQMVYETKPTEAHGVLSRDYLLPYGTPLAAYGTAVLEEVSEGDGNGIPMIKFTPIEVGKSVSQLHYPKWITEGLKVVSIFLLFFGGSVIVLSGYSWLAKIFLEQRRDEPEAPPSPEPRMPEKKDMLRSEPVR